MGGWVGVKEARAFYNYFNKKIYGGSFADRPRHAARLGRGMGRSPAAASPRARPHRGTRLRGELAPAVALVRGQPLLRHLGIEEQAGLADDAPARQQRGLRRGWRRRRGRRGGGGGRCMSGGRQSWAERPRRRATTASSRCSHSSACHRSVPAPQSGPTKRARPPTSEGSRRDRSSERVSPRVSCASSVVRSRPGRPPMSRCCTGARRSGPQPPPRPSERTRSRSSFRSSSFSRIRSISAQPCGTCCEGGVGKAALARAWPGPAACLPAQPASGPTAGLKTWATAHGAAPATAPLPATPHRAVPEVAAEVEGAAAAAAQQRLQALLTRRVGRRGRGSAQRACLLRRRQAGHGWRRAPRGRPPPRPPARRAPQQRHGVGNGPAKSQARHQWATRMRAPHTLAGASHQRRAPPC